MAMLQKNNYSRSSSSSSSGSDSVRRGSSNTQASAYVVDASTLALTGMHFSTSGAGGVGCRWEEEEQSKLTKHRLYSTGGFEVPSGRHSPTPPPSPGRHNRSSSSSGNSKRHAVAAPGDVPARHITEECERFFCETLKTVFLVEKDAGLENSLVMGVLDERKKKMTTTMTMATEKQNAFLDGPKGGRGVEPAGRLERESATPPITAARIQNALPTPSASPDGKFLSVSQGLVTEYIEVFDYVGGAVFRGFVAEQDGERALFIFFGRDVVGEKDLKPGLMSLLELASSDAMECERIVACVDRSADKEDAEEVVRSLGWVGFELSTLDHWAGQRNVTSDRWLFLGLDV